ncbi:fiber protein [Human mastadenovirus D]|uniref:Fiber protein n=1 Tax=Human mastadenovirus D TaxID=130310 RepID=A0A291B0G3_9ADEN|nr:fiber protein [Human mastadenovirus D]
MSKRLRVEDDFNPVYPYGYARNQNIPFLTPPFVSSDGFQNFPPGVLSLKLADPIAIANGNVSLKVGGGLTVEQESGNLKVNPKAPLQVATDGTLELNYDDPFKVENNKLSIKAGHGLAVVTKENTSLPSLVGSLVVLTGKGIGTGSSAHGGTIDVRIGDGGGLSFDEKGDLVAWDKKNDQRTLWTTPDPSPNCKVETEKDSKLTLILTKCGSQILANVSLLVVKGKYENISDSVNPKTFPIKLLFNDKGILLKESNLDGTYWNFRSGSNNVPKPYENAVGFMPSTTAYPKYDSSAPTNPEDKKSSGKNKIVSNIYFGGEIYQPGLIVIKFNQENNCAYSITFEFGWGKTYTAAIPFDTSSFTFSYIAQE